MLKVNEITKSVDPTFEQATCLHENDNLFLRGIESGHSVLASEGGEGPSYYFMPVRSIDTEHFQMAQGLSLPRYIRQ